MDLVYLGLTLGFFALSWALIRLCERLSEDYMTSLYLLGGIAALGLLVYLVVALLKPEVFS